MRDNTLFGQEFLAGLRFTVRASTIGTLGMGKLMSSVVPVD